MEIKELIYLGVAGYIGANFSKIIPYTSNLLWKKYSKSITSYSNSGTKYTLLEKSIIGFNCKSINNHIGLESVQNKDNWEYKDVNIIGEGEYYGYLGDFTWIKVVKKLFSEKECIMSISCSILGKNKDKIFNKLMEGTSNGTGKDNLKIFLEGNYSYIIQSKRYHNSVFGSYWDKINTHLTNWKNSKSEYIKNGITYKTGILLYGEHGCGKSSIAKVIASELDYNLYVINLDSYKQRIDEFIRLITRIPSESVILFEEIDTIVSNREENKENNQLLGLLLNVIDGAMSPEEVVFVATTNYIDRLDKALIRAGRFDLKLEFKKLGYKDSIKMVEYYGGDINMLEKDKEYNPSELFIDIINGEVK